VFTATLSADAVATPLLVVGSEVCPLSNSLPA